LQQNALERLKRRWLLPVAATVLSPAGAAVLPAQPTESFIDTVDVQVVEVDVVVTDRNGRPVKGLTREDFELSVDGQPVEITNFFESEVFQEPAEPDAQPDAPAATGIAEEPTSLTVVLYMDDANLFPPYRSRLMKRLKKAAEPLRSLNANFMLARFVNRLEVVVPPTRDLDAILEAVAKRPKGLARAVRNQRMRGNTLEELSQNNRDCQNGGQLLALADAHAAQQANQASIAIDGLADLTSTLAGLPGKKAIVYMSDGLPQQPGLSAFDYIAQDLCPNDPRIVSEAYSTARQHDETRRFQRITAHANANRVTQFTLDAAGIRTGLSQSMSFEGTRPSFQNDRVHWTNVQGGLHQLASETGGKALLNSNDLADLLDDVAEQLASSYSLGFAPDERRSGEVRRLKIELAPHAAQRRSVDYRRSYRDKTQDELLAERLISAAYLGNISNPLRMTVGLGGTTPREKKVHRLPVSIVVPEETVLMVPGSSGQTGMLRLLLLAVDEDKRGRTPVRQMTVPVGPAGDVQATDGAYRFEVSVSLPQGDYRVVVGVRDEATGELSLVTEAATVPQRASGAAGRRSG